MYCRMPRRSVSFTFGSLFNHHAKQVFGFWPDSNKLFHAQIDFKHASRLKQLLAVVENYPQLKADQNFLKLQTELVNTEDRIQAARRFYNGNIRDYRNKCETFPSNLVAKLFGFKSEGDFFSVPPSVRDVPNVDFATA